MEEKKKKLKEQSTAKVTSKKRVEELKKNSRINKDEEANEEQKRILEKAEELRRENEDSGSSIKLLKKIKKIFDDLFISFSKLETSIKICIVIPVLLFLIIIGNNIYSKTGLEYLNCTYSSTSPILILDQKLEIKFKRNSIYNVKVTTKYTEQNKDWKSVEELEKETLEKIEQNKMVKGYVADYKKTDTEFTVTEKYNYYKLNEENLKQLNLDAKLTLEEAKKKYEDFGYQCKSSK